MNQLHAPLLSLCLLFGVPSLVSAGEPVAGGAPPAVAGTPATSPWLTDLDVAKARAKVENKDLLLFFTGSDWCPPCKKLTAEVMTKPEFLTAVAPGWILVEFDFPQTKEQAAAVRERNEGLAMTYGVEGFPTVILADAQGRPYARTGYQEGGPALFLAKMTELHANKVKRDGLISQAASAAGLKKAKMLDEALSISGETLIGGYETEVAAIIAADADGKGELKGKYLAIRMRAEVRALMQKGDAAGAVKLLDGLIADPTIFGQGRQDIHVGRGAVALQQGDQKTAIAQLKLAIAAKPDSPQAAKLNEILAQFAAAPATETKAVEAPPAQAPELLMPVAP